MYPKDSAVVVKVNGVEIPINNLPYQHPSGFHIIKLKLSDALRLFKLLKAKNITCLYKYVCMYLWIFFRQNTDQTER